MRPLVVVFLSTGRCGTQWLTAGLQSLCPRLDAEHEPIGPLYQPRKYFRCYRDPLSVLQVPEVAAHVRRIEQARRPYVETGWPLFAALPLLATRLRDRLRVVHLTRHPVPSALSHLAHNSYAGSPRDDAYTRMATLGPRDPGVFQPEYGLLWDRLTPYEKCLFWWTEVHQFAVEFEQLEPGVPFLRIKSEDMLAGDRETIGRLLDFMELPWDERWLDRTANVVDRWHHHTEADLDPRLIERHPLTMKLAEQLGYSVTELNLEALTDRYRGRADPGLDRIGRFS